ncbi:nuclear transport factor 2 family protein [Mycobacterium colombiense]
MDNEYLADVEAIKQLKARYCRHLDGKDWTAFRSLFVDDFLSDTTEAAGKVVQGADEFVEYLKQLLSSRATVHQVHAPEIERTSPAVARGIWALEDVVRFGGGLNLRGYGHYIETYVRVDGHWLIQSSKLTRLREDFFTGLFSIYVSPRIRRALLRAATK